MCKYSEELIRYVLLSNDVNEYSIQEIFQYNKEKGDSNCSEVQKSEPTSSLRAFREAALRNKKQSEESEDIMILQFVVFIQSTSASSSDIIEE